ncbi:MAG: DUF1028 domain-containing protein, partial [Chloroflexota bacterium]|nr:DUF1028 domain-containing protein [Chloroflexota bacterium]
MRPSTFSIVAWDPDAQELGVATQSKFLAVGSVVPWARAGVGAVATQSYANTSFGPRGLELLEQGRHPQEVLDALLADDPGREQRQVGLVDTRGRAATFTGSECLEWAGGRTGESYACQGNILVSGATVDAMADAFEGSAGQELAGRLVAALAAGQAAGGDSRGQQSAALLVVKPRGGYAGFNDRFLDLRVDDHPAPIEELGRLLELHRLYYPRPNEAVVELDAVTREQLWRDLQTLGVADASVPQDAKDSVLAALERYSQTENLEERMRNDGKVYKAVLDYVRVRAEALRQPPP